MTKFSKMKELKKMKRALIYTPLFLVSLLVVGMSTGANAGDKSKQGLAKTMVKGDNIVFDANNISTFIRNNGSFNRNPGSGNAGFEWVKGSGKFAVYASGLWLGAKVSGQVRTAAAEYSYEYGAGPMGANINDAQWKMYKIQRGDDAKNPIPDDYANWPFSSGAPALRNYSDTADSLDGNGNKIPGLIGDMTAFCVFNDGDSRLHTMSKTDPLGMEVQMTAWAFNRSDALGNTIYYKWRFINKSGGQLDSTYVCIWCDADVGNNGGNDWDGCDTTLGLGYTYNGETEPDYPNGAAVGFDFLQGPIVPSASDSAKLPDGRILPGKKILKMTSYLKYSNDQSDYGNPGTGIEIYNYFMGLSRSGLPTKGADSSVTTFMFTGDPNSPNGPTNWIETDPPNDRRFMMTAGPFTMAANDTQDVVAGNVIASGADLYGSVTALKNSDAAVQKAYDLNFKLAAPPVPPVVEVSSIQNGLVLTWGKDEVTANKDEDYHEFEPIAAAAQAANPYYDFQGYVVYQFDNAAGVNPKRVATLDVNDGVKIIYDNVYDPSIGYYVNKPVEYGTDAGVRRSIKITTDAYTGNPLINDKNYFFGVSAYGYNLSKECSPLVLESAVTVHTVRPRLVNMGSTYSSGLDTIGTYSPTVKRTILPHSAGNGVGHAEAIITQPDSITGDTYEIRFDAIGSSTAWKIVNTTKNIVIDSLRSNQSDNDNFPIKDGVKFKVVDAPSRLDVTTSGGGVDVTPTDTSLQWIDGDDGSWGMPYFNGGLDLGANITSYLGYSGSTLPTTYNPYKKVQLILGGPTQKAYRYRRLAVGGVTRYRLQDLQTIAAQAWDITDPLHPKQLNLAWRDQVNDNVWDPSSSYLEILLICASAYDSTGAAYGDGGPWETDAMYILGSLVKPNHTLNENQNTITITPLRANGPSDVYVINTAGYKSTKGDVTIAKTQIDRIHAVPNPYFASNVYETNQFGHIVRITNLPAVAKIRIFTLAGQLLRVYDKSDPHTTSVDWDLNNANGLPVASGMYIIYVDLGAIGTKILKVAVIQAEERLNNY
jgi:hypothetical protein